jgi:hypothetical protein
MPTRIATVTEIAATPEEVWAVLTDTARFPEWNPFIPALAGELREGARLEVRIAPPGGRAMTFKPTVRVVHPGRELRWLGRLGLPGVFDGEHAFVLEPLPGGGTRLTQAETFSGVLVPLLRGMLGKTRAGFEAMNDALRLRAEARAAAAVPV